ncbi:MAG: uL30 family ribosomal protein [Candidatus Anstonellales archaeon]
MIAIIRVRGRFGLKPKIAETLRLLRLNKPNHCVVYKDSESLRGMLKVVENYVAYGEINEITLRALISKRGEIGSKSVDNVDEVIEHFKNTGKWIIDPVFRLHPPRGGWKSIKERYPKGALGKRDDMDDLLKRMM